MGHPTLARELNPVPLSLNFLLTRIYRYYYLNQVYKLSKQRYTDCENDCTCFVLFCSMWVVNPGLLTWDKVALVLTPRFETLVKRLIVVFLKQLPNWKYVSYQVRATLQIIA